MRDRFAKDYVVVMIDTDRMKGGAEVAAELRKGKDGGIPWMVILDGDGEAKITSDGPRGNVGCPAQPHEIDHFLAMLDATRQHMSEADRIVIERELRDYGAELVRSRRKEPGYEEFSLALALVRTGRFAAAVAGLRRAVEAGLAAEEILSHPALRPVREDPDRRRELAELVAAKVRASAIAMVDPYEPGERIRLRGRVVDRDTGRPVAGALVGLVQTDAAGEYRPGMTAGGGAGNPRLFGFLRTDAEGRFTADTVYPARYPDSDVPCHVHFTVKAPGYRDFEGQCFFAGDPKLTPETRARARQNGTPVVELTPDAEQRRVGELTLTLNR